MKFCLLFLTFYLSFYCSYAFSGHKEILFMIDNEKHQQNKIRLFISYLDSLSIEEKSTHSLDTFFLQLEKSEPSLKNYIVFNKQIITIQNNHDSKQRLKQYEDLRSLYKRKDNYLFEGICLLQISQYQLNFMQYEEAIKNAITANDLLKKVGYENIPEIRKYLHTLALIHFFFKDYQQVIDLMELSCKYPFFNENIDIQRDNNIAQAYIGLKRNDEAKEYLIKALNKAQKYNNNIWIGILSGSIGDLYEKEKNYTHALEYYKKGFNYIDVKKAPGVYRNFLLKISKSNFQIENIQEGKLFLNEFEKSKDKDGYFLGIQQQEQKNKKLYYETYKLYYLKINNFKKVYIYADSLHAFSAKQDSIYNKLYIDASYYKLNSEKYFLELQLKENEKKQIIYRYIILVFSISALAFLGYFIMKHKKDKQEKLFFLKEQLMNKIQINLDEEVNILKQHIQSHLNKIAENNQLLEQYRSQLKKIENNKEVNQKQIEFTQIDIDNLKILTKEHWSNFLNDFKKSNKTFYDKVLKLLPNLTQSEQRLLFLLKLGVSQKNLPNIIGTSDVNIRVTLHRLRLKIQDKEYNSDLEKIYSIVQKR